MVDTLDKLKVALMAAQMVLKRAALMAESMESLTVVLMAVMMVIEKVVSKVVLTD
jgi:hypothetical protein